MAGKLTQGVLTTFQALFQRTLTRVILTTVLGGRYSCYLPLGKLRHREVNRLPKVTQLVCDRDSFELSSLGPEPLGTASLDDG